MNRLAAAIALTIMTLIHSGAAAAVPGGLTTRSAISYLGFGFALGQGMIDDDHVASWGASGTAIVELGAETEARGLYHGNVMLSGAIDLGDVEQFTYVGGDVAALYIFPTRNRLRPYVGLGGGFSALDWRVPYGGKEGEGALKVSGIAGMAYRAGWTTARGAEGRFQTLWLLEVRTARTFGALEATEVMVRQGFLLSLF